MTWRPHYLLQNPANRPPGRPTTGRQPQYTAEQAAEFGGTAAEGAGAGSGSGVGSGRTAGPSVAGTSGYSWIGAEDVSLLDVEGTELLLVGAKPAAATGERQRG